VYKYVLIFYIENFDKKKLHILVYIVILLTIIIEN